MTNEVHVGAVVWRRSILVGLCAGALFLLVSFEAWRLMTPSDVGWFVPGDIWQTLRGTQYIADGAYGFMYENRPGPQLPLFAILLVPFFLVGRLFDLTVGDPYPLARPSMWLVIGPPATLTAIPAVAAARALVERLRPAPIAVDIGLVLSSLCSMLVFGHFEDVLALAFVLFAVRQADRGDQDRSALLLALAISCKQWAILALPLMIVWHWRPHAVRRTMLALSLPMALVTLPLVVDPTHVVRELVGAPTFPKFGHVALWVGDASSRSLTTAPARAMLAVIVIAVTLAVRRRQLLSHVATLSIIFTLRVLFEPVVHAYYVAPGLAFRLVLERQIYGSSWRTALLGVCIFAFGFVHPAPALWWIGFYALVGLALALPLKTVVARLPPS